MTRRQVAVQRIRVVFNFRAYLFPCLDLREFSVTLNEEKDSKSDATTYSTVDDMGNFGMLSLSCCRAAKSQQ